MIIVAALLCSVAAHSQVEPRLYIIDSGVNLVNTTAGPNYASGPHADCNGHGTTVGQIARDYGAGPIISVRVFDCSGGGYDASITAALQWVIADHNPANGPAAVLMAMGGPGEVPAWIALIDEAAQDGLAVIVPSGHGPDWTFFQKLARSETAIVVGGVIGTAPLWYGNFGPQIDIYASATAYGWQGTSMSAAVVAGKVIGLLRQMPWAPPAHLRTVLVDSATPTLSPVPPGTTDRIVLAPNR
ncbi:MAG: S8 family serine peptidase [Acidobacteria bacterium]|nr:S8 family serine peptidase [Acidobacteriota bacterium]